MKKPSAKTQTPQNPVTQLGQATLSSLDVLLYEVRASWFANMISSPFLQDLTGRYFAWKCKRKYRRYLYWSVLDKYALGSGAKGNSRSEG